MGRPKSPNKTEQLNVRIPVSLMTQIRTLLTEPRTGNIAHGNLSKLVIRLLSKWLEQQRESFRGEDTQ